MDYKLPNFLIVGAGRSGTTSLYHYIRQHPQVYMCPVKEPEFFAYQKDPSIVHKRNWRQIPKTLEEYKNLFIKAVNYKAVGEASVVNLYLNKEVIPLIKQYLGNVKIMAILRNPIDRAYSAYMRYKQLGEENLSFEEAITEEDTRINQGYPFAYHYVKVGLYYNQIESYISGFDQVKILLFEDLAYHPEELLKEIFSFLNVGASFIPDISEKHNQSGVSLSPFLARITKIPNSTKEMVKSLLGLFLTETQISNIGARLNRLNLKKQKLKMDHKTRASLVEFYRDDILKTGKLINRDLSGWLK